LIEPLATKIYGSTAAWKTALSPELPPSKVACGNNAELQIIGSLLLQVEGDHGDPFLHRFFVLPSFPAGVHVIVGTDLMRKLGIELRNIPVGRDQGALLAPLLALAI